MDPYIEQSGLWDDFHADLIGEIKRAIAPQLPAHYAVRTGERYYLDVCSPADVGAVDETLVQSDASVVRVTEGRPTVGGTAVLEAPVEAEVAVELEFREALLDIRELRSGRIVTTIELLSPANKRNGEGRQQYLLKRNACVVGERNTGLPSITPGPRRRARKTLRTSNGWTSCYARRDVAADGAVRAHRRDAKDTEETAAVAIGLNADSAWRFRRWWLEAGRHRSSGQTIPF
jgi:hypothetical protein